MTAVSDGYGDRLADGIDVLIAGYEREISALRQIARNLATTLELSDLGGIASLNQQLMAHGLTLEDR